MKGNAYTLLYAAVLGLVCAVTLTAVGSFTAEWRAANAEAEKVRNILGVLGVPFDPGASAEQLLNVYRRNVTTEHRAGVEFHVYERPDTGKLWAARFDGAGLWGLVEGMLCLRDDLRTIHAVSFYKQTETPGLGGEISSSEFQDQFHDKSIYAASGRAGIRIVRDGADGPNEVDAITGATMTCEKVEAMLNRLIARIAGQEGPDGK